MVDQGKQVAQPPKIRYGDIPLARIKDFQLLATMMLTLPVAWFLPEKYWPSIARLFAKARQSIKRDRLVRADHIRKIAGDHPLSMTPEDADDQYIANRMIDRLQVLRCYRPGGWQPRRRFEGREYIERVIDENTGAILWWGRMDFTPSSMRVMQESGFPIHLLSRFDHNWSTSLLGAFLLNPIRVRIENRSLAERLVLWPGIERQVFQNLKDRLKERRLVVIVVSHKARRVIEVPFLKGAMRVATAPPALSIQLGIPLIPVFTAREPDGSYTIIVKPPLLARETNDLERAIADIVTQYRDLAIPFAERYPGQFMRSHNIIAPE